MLQPIGKIFSEAKSRALQPSDVRMVAEQWLRDMLSTEQVYCVQVQAGVLSVRVGSPLLYQEVRLLEHDLVHELAQKMGYTLKAVSLIPSYY